MKKIFLLVFAFVMCKIGYAQYPMTSFLGSDSTLVISKGALQSRLINQVYVDTTAANTQRIKNYPGAQIVTNGAGMKIWLRNSTATQWLQIPAGSGVGNIYTIDGTLTGDRFVNGGNQQLQFDNFDFFDVVANPTGQLRLYQGSTNNILMRGDTTAISRRLSYNTNLGNTFTQYSLVDKNYVDSVASIGAGTVSSVGTNNGTGITGGPITTTGTLAIDTLLISTRAWRQKGIDSVASLINTNISGTTDYLSKFTSSSTIGNSAVIENANGLGINGLPTVYAGNPYVLSLDGGTSAIFDLYGAGVRRGTILTSANGMNIGTVSGEATRLAFYTNGSERMRISPTGRVGIGTTNPSEPLEIASTYGAVLTKSTNAALAAYYQLNNAGGNVYFGMEGTSGLTFGTGVPYAGVIAHFGNYPLIFETGNLPRMRITETGNLGIGLNSPDSMLTVAQGSYFQRGVRMSGLPTSPGVKQLRIDANGRLSIADTLIDAGGTVTSIATNNGTGITGGTITTTGTLAIDTTVISTRAWRQKGIDSVASLIGAGYVPYVGATQNLNLGQFGLKTEYVEFDTTLRAVTDRTLSWNNDEGTLNLGMTNGGSLTQKVGLQQFARVKNVDTVQITKGEAVYVYGASGDRTSIKRATNKGDSTSSKVLGVAAENIPINDVGLVGTFGTLSNLNLSGFTAGQILYLDSIPGQLTATKPQAPYHLVFIGVVERANMGNGLLFVNPQNGYELDELHNVRITSPVPNKAILTYDSVAQLWVDTTIAAAGMAVTSVATNTGTGITGGTITTTGTLAIDTLLISTRAWRQKGIDSVASLINTNISGTTNYIPKFTSSSAIGNSVIYESSSNIGIGTTSPAYKLDVQGGSIVNGNGTIQTAITYATMGIVGTLSNHDLALYTNNTERLRISSTGNVGIGTNTPATLLDIGTPITNALYGYSLSYAGTTVGVYQVNNATGELKFGGASAGYFPTFYSGGTERMRITSGGNVGIGTSSPANKLDVYGNIGINTSGQTRTISTFYGANSDGANIFIGGGGGSSVGAIGQTYKGAYNTSLGVDALYYNTTGYNNSAIGYAALGYNTTGYNNAAIGYAALYYNTTGYNNSAMGVSALYYNTTGYNNSAMGVSALGYNTTGYNNAAMGFAALFNNTTGYFNSAMGVDAGRYITSGGDNQTSNNSVYLGYDTRASADGNTNEIVIGSGARGNGSNSATLGNSSITKTVLYGNVGIGSTSPAHKLDVSNGSSNVYARLQTSGTSNYATLLLENGDRTWYTTNNADGNFDIGTGADPSDNIKLTLNASGNLGLGVTPSAWRSTNPAFQIGQSSSLYSYSSSNITGLGSNVYINSSGNEIYIANGTATTYTQNINGEHRWNIAASGTAGNAITFTQAMTLDASGRLGIGTTSPTYKLDVRQSSGGDIGGFYYTGGTKNPYIALQANSDNLMVMTAGNSDNTVALRFDVSNAERMRITSGGNVGIGTTSPTEKLEVNGAIKTAAPSGGTAKPWRLGTVATVSPTSPDRTIEVEIDGTTYYIHAKTTNN